MDRIKVSFFKLNGLVDFGRTLWVAAHLTLGEDSDGCSRRQFNDGRAIYSIVNALPCQMESLEKRLKVSNEAKARLAKDKKSIAAKMTRTEG